MLGIIACIIAAVKGHKTFAWVIGIWTVLAWILLLTGVTSYAVAPGILFLGYAIAMKKETSIFSESNQYSAETAFVSDPDKKFICTKCGAFSSGWYQTCPQCGAVGKMEKTKAPKPSSQSSSSDLTFPSADQMKTSQNTVSEQSTPVQRSTYNFICTNCGELSTGWYQTCPHCGVVGKMRQNSLQERTTPIPAPVTATSSSAAKDSAPYTQFCRKCGARLHPDVRFCNKCGTEIVDVKTKPAVDLPVNSTMYNEKIQPPSKPDVFNLQEKGLSPILRRAFLFAEDGEWTKADEYLEKVLDEEPENAYAYLGKLLVGLKLENIEQLSQHASDLEGNSDFIRALRYSEGDLRNYLESLKS